MQQKKNRKRLAITVALVACLAAVAGLGTLAWLTAQDDVSNVFTIGNFPDPGNEPDTDDPNTPGDEDKNESNTPNTAGYLFETNWDVDDNKLVAGVPVDKNPNVGIGAEGDSAYVFIYVRNNTLTDSSKNAASAPYFELQKQWKAVTGEADLSNAMESDGMTQVQNAYTGGLFMYAWDEDSQAAGTTPAVLESSTTPGQDTYTGEIFENVTMPALADFKDYLDDPKIDVYAYIYGYDATADQDPDEDGNYADGTAGAALKAAKDWAADLKKKFTEENQGQ